MATRSTLAVLLVAALGFAVLAQAPAKEPQLKKVEFPGGFCDLYLLAQEAVQAELGLSADEVVPVRKFVTDLIEKKQTLSFAAHVQLLRQHQESALRLLTREQFQRLKQIALQSKATASFWDPLVRQQLHVSDEQYERIQEIPYAAEGRDEKVEELARIRKDFLDYPKRAEEKWQHREWGRLAVLTPTQRGKWRHMLGKPFRGAFPSAVLVPAASGARPVQAGDPALEELKAEIRALRARLGQLERGLSEIEKGRPK